MWLSGLCVFLEQAQVLRQLLFLLNKWLSLLCVLGSPWKFGGKALMHVPNPNELDPESLEVGPKPQDL